MQYVFRAGRNSHRRYATQCGEPASARCSPGTPGSAEPGEMPGPTVIVRMREDVPAHTRLPGRLRPASGFLFGCRIALKRFRPLFPRGVSHVQYQSAAIPSQPGFPAVRGPLAAPASPAPGPSRHPDGRLRPRERGRPDRRRRQAHRARHGAAYPRRQRHRLPVPARRGAGPPGPAAHGAEERKPPRHRLHRVDRGARGREHRRVGGRSRHHHPRRRRPPASPATSSAPATCSRCAPSPAAC